MYDSSDKWCCNWSFLINFQGHTRWIRDLREESSCKVAVRCENPDLIFVHTQETLPCCRDTWPKNFQLIVKFDSWISTKYSSGRARWHLSLQQESHLYFPKLDYHTCKERRSVLTLLTMMQRIFSQGTNVCYSNQSSVVCHNALSAQCEYLQLPCVQICIPFLKNLSREAILHGSCTNQRNWPPSHVVGVVWLATP